jgi:bifunctional non-homologous end joining protein LigD
MEAERVDRIPEGPGWIHEPKWDGFRCLAFKDRERVVLQSKSGQPLGRYFPELVRAVESLRSPRFVLDGEIVVLRDGRLSFDDLLQRIHPAESRVLKLSAETPATLVLFDLLVDPAGVSLLDRPLAERKARLRDFVGQVTPSERFVLSPSSEEREVALGWMQDLAAEGFDGVVSKRRDAGYRSGERDGMLKVKRIRTADCVVGGFRYAQNSREIGSLLLGLYGPDGRLDHVGFTSAFAAAEREALKKVVLPLRAPPGFTGKAPGGPSRWNAGRSTEWEPLKPVLVCEVRYDHFSGGRFRHGTKFLRWRPDKAPEACTFDPLGRASTERPSLPASGRRRSSARSRASSGVSKRRAVPVRLTHPDRVLFPGTGLTKRGLADYYEAVADRILPHLAGRPLSLVRCPQGEGKACFYQKHAHPGTPGELRRVRIREGTGTAEGIYLYLDDAPGLLSLVQMGVLEIHPWGSRVSSLEKPDRMTIDLDPGNGVDWKRVVETAFALRSRLEALGLRSFVKTTGGKGLHVVVPLAARSSWDEVKDFSRSVVDDFVRAAPQWFVATMTKSKRDGKIFLDYFRNGRGATAVAAYSTRARPGAPVAAPLSWDELEDVPSGAAFNVGNLPARLARLRRDPWEGFFEVRQSITAAMRSAVGR